MRNDFTGLFFCAFLFLLLLFFGLLLKSGRGAFLISGYNLLPKDKKALFNEKALCRLFGNFVLVSDILLVLAVIAGIYELTWVIILTVIILFVINFSTIIYAFTNSKFRN